ncbi:MAG: hypothetical protein FWC58_11485 [Desulfobulbus sp.]|nr:hypothetical protein [Desulfobulbus sp.]
MTPENFLFLGPAIEDRLRAALPAEVRVTQAYDLAHMNVQFVPAVFVIYSRFRVTEASVPAFASVEQTWLTVIAVRNAANHAVGNAAREEAGRLAIPVIDALQQTRFTPARGLKLAEALPAGSDGAGFYYLPLAWTAGITLAREQCPN